MKEKPKDEGLNQGLDATGLLNAAAVLVERALGQIDTEHVSCPTCGNTLFRDTEHAKLNEQLTELPDKLRRAALRASSTELKASRGYHDVVKAAESTTKR